MIIPQTRGTRKQPPQRLLLGSDGAPSVHTNTRYYSVPGGEILIIRNGNTARMSRADTLSDLRGRLLRLQGYANADACREQMMSAIEATVQAIEALR